MHTAEPLIPEPSCLEDEISLEKLKRYKSPSINQVSAKLIQAGVIHYVLMIYTNLFSLE